MAKSNNLHRIDEVKKMYQEAILKGKKAFKALDYNEANKWYGQAYDIASAKETIKILEIKLDVNLPLKKCEEARIKIEENLTFDKWLKGDLVIDSKEIPFKLRNEVRMHSNKLLHEAAEEDLKIYKKQFKTEYEKAPNKQKYHNAQAQNFHALINEVIPENINGQIKFKVNGNNRSYDADLIRKAQRFYGYYFNGQPIPIIISNPNDLNLSNDGNPDVYAAKLSIEWSLCLDWLISLGPNKKETHTEAKFSGPQYGLAAYYKFSAKDGIKINSANKDKQAEGTTNTGTSLKTWFDYYNKDSKNRILPRGNSKNSIKKHAENFEKVMILLKDFPDSLKVAKDEQKTFLSKYATGLD